MIKKWTKVKGVFIDISFICVQLKRDIQQCEQTLTPIGIVSASSAIDLHELDPSFMYSQLLKEILLKMEHSERVKQEFVNFLRVWYHENHAQLHTIDKFERDYDRSSPIWWYTKESFIFSMLNRALRTQDIDIIMMMGFIIRDLHRQIEELHSKVNYHHPYTVYRGQGLASAEFEKLRKSKGGLLSFNNFLSTSADRNVSLAFADSARDNPELTGILFRIEIDPSISSTPFALLNTITNFSDENEILFSMHTVFRIGEMQHIEGRLWQIDLILTNDNDQQLKLLTDYLRNETKGTTWQHRLGNLMFKIGEFEKAKIYFKTLIDTISDEESIHWTFHNQLACAQLNNGNFKAALTSFENALEIQQKILPSNPFALAKLYNNIGITHKSMGNYSDAQSYYTKALELGHKTLPSSLPFLGEIYNNIAELHNAMGDHSTALKYLHITLQIRQKHLPPTHPDLASIYNNIGEIHDEMGDHDTALSHYNQTLEILRKALIMSHPSWATAYSNIGEVHDKKGDYPTALLYYKKALEIQQKILPSIHPELAMTYGRIAMIYHFMGDNMTALSYLQKTLEIFGKVLPPIHIHLATIYNNTGKVYSSMGNHTTALLYLNKTLEIRQKLLPPIHPELAMTYNNIGMVHQKMENHSIALSYLEKALEIRQKALPSDHCGLATIYNNIAL